MFGGMRHIQCVGRFQFKKSDPSKAWVKGVLPVRIVRSALAPNVPQADLYVTQTHALVIDGVLVPAGNLVNDIRLHSMRRVTTTRWSSSTSGSNAMM